MVEIKEARTAAQMKKFALFPIKLYKGNPYFVPPFTQDEKNLKNVKKNYSAQGCIVKCFLAYRDGKIVGRIAGIIVKAANEKFGEKNVRFSRFDYVNDVEVAEALLGAVADFGRENGMDTIHGPWGFNDTDREGALTFGFDEISTFATNYNYAYYPEIMQKLGYSEESKWVEYRLGVKEYDSRYGEMAKAVVAKYGFRELADELSVKQIVDIYGDKFFDCYNDAYKHLDQYIPIEGDAKKSVLKSFATVVNKDYISVVVDPKTDKVVAFGVAIPALGKVVNKHKGKLLTSIIGLIKTIKNPDGLELSLVGVSPEYRRSGVNAMVIDRI